MSGKFRPARKVSRSGRCLDGGLGEIEVAVKMRPSRSRTKRPRGALLQLAIGARAGLRRIGGRRGGRPRGGGGGGGEIPLCLSFDSNLARKPGRGPCQVGSLTGAVASQRVTEAPKGSLRLVGNQPSSAMTQGSLTARPTSQAGTKVGHSDPAIACGSVVAQRIKGTPGITG